MSWLAIIFVLLTPEYISLLELNSPIDRVEVVFADKELAGYPKPGYLPLLNRKIVRGTRVSITEHPYMVSIRRLTAHFLTGTLISRHAVLTVAHPLIEVPINELGAVVGENYSDRGSELLTIILILVHDQFNQYTLEADLAILRFYEVVVQTKVKPVKTHRFRWRPNSTITGFVTGWGRCEVTGEELCFPRSSDYYPGELSDPMLKTISFQLKNGSKYCKAYQNNDVKVGRGMLCLGAARQASRTSPCLAVPGAPLVVAGELVGIQSWGFGCGYPNDLPLIYSSASYYHKWITGIVQALLRISNKHLKQLYEVTKAVVFIDWFEKTRINISKSLSNEEDIQPIYVDRILPRLPATVYDIRDFIDDKRYKQAKQRMFQLIQVMPLAKPNTDSSNSEGNAERNTAEPITAYKDYFSEFLQTTARETKPTIKDFFQHILGLI